MRTIVVASPGGSVAPGISPWMAAAMMGIAISAVALPRPAAAAGTAEGTAAGTAAASTAANTAAERVPIPANFSPTELVAVGTLVTLDVLSGIFQPTLVEWRGEPNLGEPWAWDRRISDELYRGPGTGPLWGRVPDRAGTVAPLLALGFYGLDVAWQHLGDGALTGDPNADHELLAFAEAYSLTLGITQLAKLSLGRERPEFGLARDPTLQRDDEATLSFFSGHSSSSFCVAAFVHRDVSDWLVRSPLRGGSSASKLWLGRVLPGVILYGAAGVIAGSRIVDQKHYFTDVLVGTMVGATMGNLVYALHFDDEGRPRRRRELELTPTQLGFAFGGSF